MNTMWIIENRKVVEISPIDRKSYSKNKVFVVYKAMRPLTHFLVDGDCVTTQRVVVDKIDTKSTFKSKEDAIAALVNIINEEISSFQQKIDLLTKEIENLLG